MNDSDRIAPAEFRPADARRGRRRRGPRPARLAVVLGLLALVAVAAFMFMGRPVQIAISPVADDVDVVGGPSFAIGERFLLLPGDYVVRATREGYHPLEAPISVAAGGRDRFEFELRPLPGRLSVTTTPVEGAEVRVDGAVVGTTPLVDADVEAGARRITVEAPRYLPVTRELGIEGRRVRQQLDLTLEPAWADVTVRTRPEGARVTVDGEEQAGTTPLTVEVIAGERELGVHLEGYESVRRTLEVRPREPQALPVMELEPVDGLLRVTTRPAGATVTVADIYRGRSPLEVDLDPGRTYRVDLFKPGHERVSRDIRIRTGEAHDLAVDLPEVRGELRVRVTPADARLLVDGIDRGPADQVIALTAVDHTVEIKKPGYVPFRASITPRPGFPQEIELDLKTVEQARLEAIEPVITAPNGQKLILLRPTAFTMGASRREPGRRANEVLREVTLTRPYYLSTTEVSNEQFAEFASGHDSGAFEDFDLDEPDQPVVNVAWHDAVRYCNWLSQRAGLAEVYIVENGRVTGFDPDATGYRLPTEAEWAWVARHREGEAPRRFPWGEGRLPPEDRVGNFADRAAVHLLARTIPDYTDGYVTTAPVGHYEPDELGFYDIGGNVAEWVNDFYAATSEELPSGVTDPLGPPGGDYHVIRGSSWMHGQLVDLRLSFRDYGREGRPDVGFRIARWLE